MAKAHILCCTFIRQVVRELHFSVDYRLYNATPQPRRPDRPTVSGEKRWLNLNRPDEQDLVEVKMPLIVAWTERRALRFCTGITPSHFSWKCEVNSILHLSEVLFNCDVKESFTRCYAAFCACYSSSYKPRRWARMCPQKSAQKHLQICNWGRGTCTSRSSSRFSSNHTQWGELLSRVTCTPVHFSPTLSEPCQNSSYLCGVLSQCPIYVIGKTDVQSVRL